MDTSTFENDLKACMSNQWFKDKINQCNYSYTKSPERNRLQNCFLHTEFQNLVIKKCVNEEYDLSSPDINKFYETEFYKKCMNGKRFTLDTKIDIEFNPDTFWDVKMTQRYIGHCMTCLFFDMQLIILLFLQ